MLPTSTTFSSPISSLCVATMRSTDTPSTDSSPTNSNSGSPEQTNMAELLADAEDNNSWLCSEAQHFPPFGEDASLWQSRLLYRPQPRRYELNQLPMRQPVQVHVPFLINYDDILKYGPQLLPTVLEVENENDTDSDSDKEDFQRTPNPLENNGNSQVYYSEEPVSNSYSYVGCYQDHRWDLARGDAVLTEAMYYHVLEPTYTGVPTLFPSVPPNLVRPQAMRVVCPTTIGPLQREDRDEVTQGEHKAHNNWYLSVLGGCGATTRTVPPSTGPLSNMGPLEVARY